MIVLYDLETGRIISCQANAAEWRDRFRNMSDARWRVIEIDGSELPDKRMQKVEKSRLVPTTLEDRHGSEAEALIRIHGSREAAEKAEADGVELWDVRAALTAERSR